MFADSRREPAVADWEQFLRSSPMKKFPLIAVAALLALTAGVARPAGPDIYPDPAQAKPDLAAALKTAAATHRRIILDFGGNWCGDCKVLDIYMHDDKNKPLVDANFVVVHINVGHYDANLDLAEKYEIPLKRGVPALAVLSDHGKLLYTQKNGEFEAMRRVESASVTDFLVHWRPGRPGCSAVMVNC
jgi:thiol-disulfide isomerase/thioredoxin